jgi:hypothetical protein
MDAELIPPVLIDDDGELDEVRRLLDELEIEYAVASSSGSDRASLLISNARHALARATGVAADRSLSGGFHLVVAEKISRRAQRELERVRPDFLVQRPVDPAPLRLVVLHALYSGPERRRSPRVAMSAVVRCRAGVVSRAATLVELSQSGCRLTSGQTLRCGQLLTVIVPRELTVSRRLSIEGCVVAVAPAGELDPRRQAYSIQFQRVDAETRRALREVMVMHGLGSAILQPHPRPGSVEGDHGASACAEASEDAPAAASASEMDAALTTPSERRVGPRGKFKRRVLAAARGGANILIGRDLSVGGMRVDPHPALNVGDDFKLVIHGHVRKHPLVVKAFVARDEGGDGCVLQFHAMTSQASAQLERIIDSLPCLRSPGRGGAAGPNVVVSEVVEDS